MVRHMAVTTMDGIDPLACVGDMAVRFADEGVPVRAIARAIRISPEIIRDYLKTAYGKGQLFELPKDDWSPKLTRDARVPELDRLVEKHENLYPQAMHCFSLTPQQARMLLILIKYPLVSREKLYAVGSRRRLRPGIDPDRALVTMASRINLRATVRAATESATAQCQSAILGL